MPRGFAAFCFERPFGRSSADGSMTNRYDVALNRFALGTVELSRIPR